MTVQIRQRELFSTNMVLLRNLLSLEPNKNEFSCWPFTRMADASRYIIENLKK